MRLAVASGKGGTGKTLFATNLSWCIAEAGHSVAYVDTDVEAPNGHLFLHPSVVEEARLSVTVPMLNGGTCSGCGACQEACEFNAIIALKDRVMVFPELCHGCGACHMACEERALTETRREIGTVRHGQSGEVAFWSATLDVGEARTTPLIQGLLEATTAKTEAPPRLTILDSSPGTSCNAVSVARSADLVLLVTEPTPFGLHDLELAVQMCRALGKPVAASINRADIGDNQVRRWLEREKIRILAEVPFSREVAAAYVRGELAASTLPKLRTSLESVARAVSEEIP